jgi:cytoskeletal protein RodZ
MTTPDQITPGQDTTSQPPGDEPGRGQGAWAAVARLLSLQLLTVIAVTAIITGIYALTGPHKGNKVTAASTPTHATGSRSPSSPAATTPAASTPATSTPPASPAATATAPASPTTSQPPPEAAQRLKVDVLNQSGSGGTAARMATRVRALGWTVGRVGDFSGNVSRSTVYYPLGEAPAAHELASALPGKPRVLPRFSTLAAKRLTLILVR